MGRQRRRNEERFEIDFGPGQGCIFVYEGKVQAEHDQECLVTIETANIPFWKTIRKFMQSFESEHKVGIYFFRTTKILNQKWGPLPSIKYEDLSSIGQCNTRL